jgi:hypothetical protein
MDRISRQKPLTGRRSCGRADRRAIRAAASALLIGVAVNASCVALVSAQDEPSTSKPGTSAAPPMPPARPSTLVAPKAAVVATPLPAPDQSSTLAAPKASAAAAAAAPLPAPNPKVTEDTSALPWTPGKLLQLPPYTRARMHECVLEWEKMKAQGAAAEKIWYAFAQSCLLR